MSRLRADEPALPEVLLPSIDDAQSLQAAAEATLHALWRVYRRGDRAALATLAALVADGERYLATRVDRAAAQTHARLKRHAEFCDATLSPPPPRKRARIELVTPEPEAASVVDATTPSSDAPMSPDPAWFDMLWTDASAIL